MKSTLRFLVWATAGALVAVLAAGCACTNEARSGLRVTVTDKVTGMRICDAVVTAVDGSYSEKLLASGGPADCQYQGAFERPGRYTVTAVVGARTGSSPVTVVDEDGCHVDGQAVSVALDP